MNRPREPLNGHGKPGVGVLLLTRHAVSEMADAAAARMSTPLTITRRGVLLDASRPGPARGVFRVSGSPTWVRRNLVAASGRFCDSGAVSIRVTPVDPADDQSFARYHETFVRAASTGRTDPTLWSEQEARVSLSTATASERQSAYVAIDGERVVGAGDLTIPLADNTNLLEFDFAVLPEERRRGVGTAMFEYVRDVAREHGRTLVGTELNVTTGTERSAPGALFLAKQGLTLRHTEYRNQQRLPVPDERLAELATKAAERTADYRILTWVDDCPDEYAEQYVQLRALLMVEAPTGDLEFEQENWTVDRLREEEAVRREQGRVAYTTVAVAPDGSLAGHTQLIVPTHDPGRAYQDDTLVLSAHRGHRLGLACKVANLRTLQAEQPAVTRIETWNDNENEPMMAVNRDLGYQPIEVCQEWQGELRP